MFNNFQQCAREFRLEKLWEHDDFGICIDRTKLFDAVEKAIQEAVDNLNRGAQKKCMLYKHPTFLRLFFRNSQPDSIYAFKFESDRTPENRAIHGLY